jgi:hypothetical protein
MTFSRFGLLALIVPFCFSSADNGFTGYIYFALPRTS